MHFRTTCRQIVNDIGPLTWTLKKFQALRRKTALFGPPYVDVNLFLRIYLLSFKTSLPLRTVSGIGAICAIIGLKSINLCLASASDFVASARYREGVCIKSKCFGFYRYVRVINVWIGSVQWKKILCVMWSERTLRNSPKMNLFGWDIIRITNQSSADQTRNSNKKERKFLCTLYNTLQFFQN